MSAWQKVGNKMQLTMSCEDCQTTQVYQGKDKEAAIDTFLKNNWSIGSTFSRLRCPGCAAKARARLANGPHSVSKLF